MLIYLLLNTENGKCYIGQTVRNLARRWDHHLYDAAHGKSTVLAKAIRKYGKEAFERHILATADTQEQLNLLETAWIIALNARVPHGYNLKLGGANGHLHESTKQKLRLLQTGRKWTPEMREAASVLRRGRIPWNKGKGKPKAAKKPRIPWNKGIAQSPAMKARISATLKGKNYGSLEARRNGQNARWLNATKEEKLCHSQRSLLAWKKRKAA